MGGDGFGGGNLAGAGGYECGAVGVGGAGEGMICTWRRCLRSREVCKSDRQIVAEGTNQRREHIGSMSAGKRKL